MDSALLSIFACPRCDKTPLESSDEQLRCTGCSVDFPRIGGIHWLFAEPVAALGEWRGRLHFQLQSLARDEQRLRHALDDAALPALSAQRIAAMADALAAQADLLGALLAPLEIDTLTAAHETYLALRTRLPSDQGLLTYYNNVHRDWCWGDAENAASLDIVLERLNGREPGRTLVLGAGAGRLAYDLHQQTSAPLTLALDFNPFLLLLAERITAGEAIELYEFPRAPRDMAHQAILRTLSAPEPARAGLAWCLADAHRPPFAKRSFDTIVTPWLVDILPEPLDSQAARINQLLADDGHWINFGSLSFHGADPAEQLSLEECLERIEAAGFAAPEHRDTEIPYLSSPASRHGRRELVLSWSARKKTDVRKLPRHESLPDWIVRGKNPVPLLDDFRAQAMSTRIHGFIMSLIDGRRSIADMASVLEEQRLMTRAEAEPAIRSFLIKMYEDSRRRKALGA
jgi:uncharacterized protein YbaR (Trm112 family)